MSNGIANLQRNVPVAVKVANMSRAIVTLAKNERVGCAVPAPVNILAIDFEGEPPRNSEMKGGKALTLSARFRMVLPHPLQIPSRLMMWNCPT